MKVMDACVWLWIVCLLLLLGLAPFVMLALVIKFLFF